MKTIKQIAEEIGIDKQRVYRYIRKNHINEAHQENGVMWYDEAAETQIKHNFLIRVTVSSEAHQEAHQTVSSDAVIDAVVSMLQRELSEKNKIIGEQQQTIRELTATVRAQAESINTDRKNELAGTLLDGQQKLMELERLEQREEQPQKKRGFLDSFKNKYSLNVHLSNLSS